jgi:hypothetical protein
MREWMEQRHPRLLDAWLWLWLRLSGSRCWAQGCGRLLVLHTPRQLDRCYDTPLAIGITVRGWLLSRGLDPGVLDAWCASRGIDPNAVLEPIPQFDPVSVA